MGVLVIHALPANVAAIRPHHWAKNLLIFAPIILGQRWASVEAWRSAAVCFLSFSLFASFIYILNDLLDRDSDRLHATKRLRPIASGRITRPRAGIIAILLLVGGAVSALSLPQPARLAILAYVVSATVYSTWAKSLPVVDVLLLGSFYTMRVLAGGAATSIPNLALDARVLHVPVPEHRLGQTLRRGRTPWPERSPGLSCGRLARAARVGSWFGSDGGPGPGAIHLQSGSSRSSTRAPRFCG